MDRQTSTCHVVATPYPGRGHINPVMSLCKILASQAPHVAITFVLTEETEKGDEKVGFVPGIPPMHLTDLVDEKAMQRMRPKFNWVRRTQYLLLSSVYEMESRVVDALKLTLSLPIYTIGPSIPYFELEDNPRSNSNSNYTIDWLDRQPGSSVLYLSLGSFLSALSSKIDEIAAGLRGSKVRFLWVARDEVSRLKELLPDGDMGIVVPSCNQLRALTNPSVGGLWTHCRWNSIQEGVYAGLPFLVYPIAMDQGLYCKLVVDDWKVGWTVDEGHITGLVQKFTDSGDNESRELRCRVDRLRELCHRAIGPDGSSGINIGAFIRDISHGAAKMDSI